MKDKTKRIIKSVCARLEKTPLVKLMSWAYEKIDWLEYRYYDRKWKIEGYELPGKDEILEFQEDVTFIFKSFNRQKLAVRLIRSIQNYYPGCRIIVADDSQKPLSEFIRRHPVNPDNLMVLQLPFNSGLSYGLQCALDKVTTPYMIRMDDDQRLTRRSQFGKQLRFLKEHSDVDLSGVMQFTTPVPRDSSIACREFFFADLGYPQRKPKVEHMTQVDEDHVVVLKASNVFMARTEKMREVGYDSNIRMIDHNDFFCRACGILVSVIDTTALVHHSHNRFDHAYEKFRGDFEGDYTYIFGKYFGKRNSDDQSTLDN